MIYIVVVSGPAVHDQCSNLPTNTNKNTTLVTATLNNYNLTRGWRSIGVVNTEFVLMVDKYLFDNN